MGWPTSNDGESPSSMTHPVAEPHPRRAGPLTTGDLLLSLYEDAA